MIQCESSQVDLILVSFSISIFGVNSIKINILCENVGAFFYMYQAKKFFNLQVEIILGIISIIILSSLIVLNRSIIIFSESSTHQISLACCFPKVDSVITFDFFFQYNLVYFDFVRTSNSPKSCVWYHCIKLLFERVWWEFCLINCFQ